MDNVKMKLIVDSVSTLQNCKNTLTEISKTCCMPERSPAENSIDELISMTNNIKTDKKNIHQCIERIGVIGSQMGFLYATCCTATREPLYQKIFKELMEVHVNMWSIQGDSHG